MPAQHTTDLKGGVDRSHEALTSYLVADPIEAEIQNDFSRVAFSRLFFVKIRCDCQPKVMSRLILRRHWAFPTIILYGFIIRLMLRDFGVGDCHLGLGLR